MSAVSVVSTKALDKSFDEDMKQFMGKRMDRANYSATPEYKRVSVQYDALLEKIKDFLPREEAKNLILELDEVIGHMSYFQQIVNYRLGFEDGIRFYKIGANIL